MSFPNENSDNNTCIMQEGDSNQEISANEGESQSIEPEMTQPDGRGIKMWEQVMALIAEIENPCH